MVRAGRACIQCEGNQNIAMYGMIEIIGEPDERRKVIAACDWMKSVCGTSNDVFGEYVKRVIVLKDGVAAFLPVEKTIFLMGMWLGVADLPSLARLMTMGANYFRECELHGKYGLLTISSPDMLPTKL